MTEINNHQLVQSLIVELGDPDVLRRIQAQQQLQLMGECAVESLCQALRVNNGCVARRIAEILAQIDDPRCIPCLLEAARTDNPILRQKIIIELGSLRDDRVIDTLCDALHDSLELVRVSAAQALGRIGNRRAIACLLDALKCSCGETFQFTILEALGMIGDPSAIPTVRDYLDHANRHIRSRAIRAMQKLEPTSEPSAPTSM